jgi:modulator of FtsH protease HflK
MQYLRYFLICLFLAYLATGFVQVGYDERAVVRRFGQVVARPGPGLWIGFPWGIDRVNSVQVRTVRQLAIGYLAEESNEPTAAAGQILTGDQNLVNLKLVIEYSVDDRDGEIEQYLANEGLISKILANETETLAMEWIGTRTVDEVLSGRAGIAIHVADQLQTRLAPHRLGVVIQRVSVAELSAPEEVQEAFQQVNQAQTNIRTRRNQAEQEAQRLLSDAEMTQVRLAREATAYEDEKIKVAQADASTFLARLAQYQQMKQSNPDILTALWREEIGKPIAGMKGRGRIEILDDLVGPNGIELNQFLPTNKR